MKNDRLQSVIFHKIIDDFQFFCYFFNKFVYQNLSL
jgi:hypothetical protein